MDAPISAGRKLILVVAILVAAATVNAHVRLDHPNGGEMLEAGTITVIEWHVIIAHATLNWDLWYSVTGPGGPWIEIAADLPPGDISAGSIHTYDWTVPGLESNQVRVRVRQDNDGTDYEDVSDGDLTITEGIFTDGFESGFTDEWSATVP